MQNIITPNNGFEGVKDWLREVHKPLVVCGRSAEKLNIFRWLDEYVEFTRFSDFSPNPNYDSVMKGVHLFREKMCDGIIAIGGGSAIDVAKCIRLYSSMQGNGENGSFLKQKVDDVNLPLLVVPTTAGTGSEATRFAVIYYEGQKQSVTTDRVPDTVLMDSSVLETLPLYQRKATMLDVLSHAVESYWSIRSTDESKKSAVEAIHLFLKHKDGYLKNEEAGNAGMLLAANKAGIAINITQTTVGHAMCYKITSLFGCAHGHAAALCNRILLGWMVENTDKCLDPRGEDYLKQMFDELGAFLGGKGRFDGSVKLRKLIDNLGLDVPIATEEQFQVLRTSVNPVRLKNNPIELDVKTIDMLYHRILRAEA